MLPSVVLTQAGQEPEEGPLGGAGIWKRWAAVGTGTKCLAVPWTLLSRKAKALRHRGEMVRCNVAEGKVGGKQQHKKTSRLMGSTENHPGSKILYLLKTSVYHWGRNRNSHARSRTTDRKQRVWQPHRGVAGMLRTVHPEPRVQVFLKTVAWPGQ